MSTKKRGANGAGTIRQRPDGRWEARFTLGRDPGTGKQRQRSIYGLTQKEVRQKLQKAMIAVDDGSYIEPSRLTVREWLTTWLEEYAIDVKSTTRTRYRQDMENHIFPALGAVKLSELTPTACQTFYNSLAKKDPPLSPKSVRNVHGVLHHAIKQAMRLGYMASNPTDACTLPRVEKPRVEALDAPQIKMLLDALGDDVYSMIIRVDLFTGLRSGEILGLQWPCVDFEHGTITVDKQLQRPRLKGEHYRLAAVKNDKPRTIQPAPFVMQLLNQRRRQQMQDRLKYGIVWDDDRIPDLVFTYENGKHIDATILLRHLKKTLKAAGLPDIRFHDLRHTYAVASIQAGDDVKTVQENLGHHTAAFTLDQYGHVTESMREASARRMEAFIENLT